MARPLPSGGRVLLATFRLRARRLLRGRRVWLGIAAVVLIDVAIIATRFAAQEVELKALFNDGVTLGYFGLLVYLVPFLLCSGAIAEEVEARTLPFLTTRPVPRPLLAMSQFAAGAAYAVGLLGIGLLLLHLVVFASDATALVDGFPSTLRQVGSLSLLAILYGAICAFWGTIVPEASGVVSAIFLAVFEFGFGVLPDRFRFASMNFWGRELAGLDRGGMFAESVPEVALWVAPIPIGIELVVFLGLTALVMSTSEFRFGKA